MTDYNDCFSSALPQSRLSGGAVAGIVTSVQLVVALVVFVAVIYRHHLLRRPAPPSTSIIRSEIY